MPVTLLPVNEGPPIQVDAAIVLVGRHRSCDVVISHSLKVSRKHCCLVLLGDRCLIRDLGSLNGVWINGRRINREAYLKPGDLVAIADVEYVVQRQVSEDGGKLPSQEAAASEAEPPSFPDSPLPIPDLDSSKSTAEDEAAGGSNEEAGSQQASDSALCIPFNSGSDDSGLLPPLADVSEDSGR